MVLLHRFDWSLIPVQSLGQSLIYNYVISKSHFIQIRLVSFLCFRIPATKCLFARCFMNMRLTSLNVRQLYSLFSLYAYVLDLGLSGGSKFVFDVWFKGVKTQK